MKGLIFVYGLTYGGAALSLINPYWGFLIYVAFGNLRPDFLWFWSVPAGGNYSRIVAIGLLAGWLMHGMGSWTFGKAKATVYCLLFYWAWIAFGAYISPEQQMAWFVFDILSKVFLPLIVGMTLINSLARLKQLAWVLVATQGFLALQFNERYYTSGIDTNAWKFATMDNNGIGLTAVTALGLAIFMAMQADRLWQRLLTYGASALLAHVVLFSMSRGAMLAMCVTGVTSFLLIPKKPLHYVVLILGGIIVLRLAGPQVQQEFISSFADKEHRDASADSRIGLTRDALTVMIKNPILGCGMENWVNVAPEYGWPQGKRAHNTFAETGATLGIPGLAAILLFYGITCYRLIPLTRDSTPVDDPWIRGLARGVIAAMAGFFVTAAFVTVDRVELPYYIIMIGAGVLKVHSLGPAGTLSERMAEDCQPDSFML